MGNNGGVKMKLVQPIRDLGKLEELLGVLKEKSFRNYIIFMLGINTGLRISDILKLKVSDVSNLSIIKIKEKKTGKENRLLITSNLKRELKKYIAKMDQKEYLIQPRGGINKALSIKMAYKALKEGALKCKIDELGTHTMRKTFGYFHYKKFKNIAVLMSIFNHSAESITLKYIGINQDNKDKTMRNFGLG